MNILYIDQGEYTLFNTRNDLNLGLDLLIAQRSFSLFHTILNPKQDKPLAQQSEE